LEECYHVHGGLLRRHRVEVGRLSLYRYDRSPFKLGGFGEGIDTTTHVQGV
jgi:hypothetical protein